MARPLRLGVTLPLIQRSWEDARAVIGWGLLWLALLAREGQALPADDEWRPTLADFALPPKSVFPPEMPRYPNLWIFVEQSLAPAYPEAVRLVTKSLQSAMQLREIPGPFDNPEGCDSDFRLEHLQPWETSEHRALQHSHALHLRYYHRALEANRASTTRVKTTEGDQLFYRLAASVHYEVEHSNPNHADVEICPICGRTGEYGHLKGNLVEMVHDPLGLELVLSGTIRGTVVRFEDWKQEEVGSIAKLRTRFSVRHFVYAGLTDDRNTLRIGVVVLSRGE